MRDFYKKRVECYVAQVGVDIPASTPTPDPSHPCKIGPAASGYYLANYPRDLPGTNGVSTPTSWPYDATSLADAEAWCCAHGDCGGVTHQNGRYEVRAGSSPIKDPQGDQVVSYPKLGAHTGTLNQGNLTKCVTAAELDFTQGTATTYIEQPTTNKTLALSAALIGKYAAFFV